MTTFTKRHRGAPILGFALFFSLFFSACKGDAPEESERKKTIYELHGIDLKTPDNAGPWQSDETIAHTHEPTVFIKKKGNKKVISVSLLIQASERHYIEKILLLDHNFKELQTREFLRNETAVTEFTLDEKYNTKVYVVAKCNIHDMWVKPISW